MANEWHVPYELLKPETREMARAIQSLMEELEAIDWYNQRADVTEDAALRRVLEHNRDEEKEHAAMVLEWIRRHDPKLDEALRKYLFTSADLVELETAPGPPPAAKETPQLTVGSLRPRRDQQ